MGGGGGLTQIAAAVVGGVVGFVTGGPAGALRGAAIGYTLFAKKPQPPAAGSVVDTPDTGQLATAIGENAWVPKAYGNRRGGVVLIATDVMTETTETGFEYKIVGENESGGYATSVYALGEGPWNKINNLIYNNNKLFKDDVDIEFNTRYGFGHNIWSTVQDYSNMEVYFARGDRDQTVPSILTEVRLAEVEEDGNLNWFRSTDTGAGICYMVLRIRRDKDAIIRETAPNLIIDAETKLVPDVRQQGTPLVYSTNPSLIALDQLRGIYVDNVQQNIFGFGVTDNEIDFDSFVNFANYCDDPNEYDNQSPFTINGQFRQGSTIKDILEDISLATGAIFEDMNGIIRVQTDKSETVNTGIAITQDNVVGNINRTEPKTSEVPNVMNVKFRNQQGNEVIEVVSFGDTVLNREGRKEADLDLRMVQSTEQAREMGKRALYLNRASSFEFDLNNTGYNLDVHDVCSISDILDQDIVADESRIRILTATKQRITTGNRRAPVRVSAKLYNDQVYSIDPNNSDEISVIPDNSVFSDAPSQTFIPLPTGVTVSRLTDTTAIVSWDSQPNYTAQIQIRSTDSGEIFRTKSSVVSDDRVDIDFINAGTYDVAVRYIDPSTGSTGSRSVVTYTTNGIQTNLSDNGVTIIDDEFGAFQYKYGEFVFGDDENGTGIRPDYVANNETQEVTANQPYDQPVTLMAHQSHSGAKNHSITLTVPDNFNADSETNETFRIPYNPDALGGPIEFTDPDNYQVEYEVRDTVSFPQWDGSKWLQYFSYLTPLSGTEYKIRERQAGVEGAVYTDIAVFGQSTSEDIEGSRVADALVNSFYKDYNGKNKPYEMVHDRENNRVQLEFILESDFLAWEFELTQVGGNAGDWSPGERNGRAGSGGGYQYVFNMDGMPGNNGQGGEANGDQRSTPSGENNSGSIPTIPTQDDVELVGSLQDLTFTFSNGAFRANVFDTLLNGSAPPGTGENGEQELLTSFADRGALYLGLPNATGGNLITSYTPASFRGTIQPSTGSVTFTAGPVSYYNTNSQQQDFLPELTNGGVYVLGPGARSLRGFIIGYFTGVAEPRGIAFVDTGSGTVAFSQGTSGDSSAVPTYQADEDNTQVVLQLNGLSSTSEDPFTGTEGGGVVTYIYPENGNPNTYGITQAIITLADSTIQTLPSTDLYLYTERYIGEETFGANIETPIEGIDLGPQDPDQTDIDRILQELQAFGDVAVNQRLSIGATSSNAITGTSFPGDPNLPALDSFIGQPYAQIFWTGSPRSGVSSSFVPTGDLSANYAAFDSEESSDPVASGPGKSYVEAGSPIEPYNLIADLDTTAFDSLASNLNLPIDDDGFDIQVPYISEIEQRFSIDPNDADYTSARKYLIWLQSEIEGRYNGRQGFNNFSISINSSLNGWTMTVDYGDNEPFGLSNNWSSFNLQNEVGQSITNIFLRQNAPDYIITTNSTFATVGFPESNNLLGVTANELVSGSAPVEIYRPIPNATGQQFATTFTRVINDQIDGWSATDGAIDTDTANDVNNNLMTRMITVTRDTSGNSVGLLNFNFQGVNNEAIGFVPIKTSYYLPKSFEVNVSPTENAIRNKFTELTIDRTAFTDNANQAQAITDFETALGDYFSVTDGSLRGFKINKTTYDSLSSLSFTLDNINWEFEEITDEEIPDYIITDNANFNRRYGNTVSKNSYDNTTGSFIRPKGFNLSQGNVNFKGSYTYGSFTATGSQQAIVFTTDISDVVAGDYLSNQISAEVLSVDINNNALVFSASTISNLLSEAGGSIDIYTATENIGVFKATLNNKNYYLYKRALAAGTPDQLFSIEAELGWVITTNDTSSDWYWFITNKQSYTNLNDTEASALSFNDLENAKIVKIGTGVGYQELSVNSANNANLSLTNWNYTNGTNAVPYTKIDYQWTVSDTIPMTINFNPNFDIDDNEITNRPNELTDNISVQINNGVIPEILNGGTRYIPIKDEISITEGSSRAALYDNSYWNYSYQQGEGYFTISNVDSVNNRITLTLVGTSRRLQVRNRICPTVPLFTTTTGSTRSTTGVAIVTDVISWNGDTSVQVEVNEIPTSFTVNSEVYLTGGNNYVVSGSQALPEGHINSAFQTIVQEFNEDKSGDYEMSIDTSGANPILQIEKLNNVNSNGYYEWSYINRQPGNEITLNEPFSNSVSDHNTEFGTLEDHSIFTDYDNDYITGLGEISFSNQSFDFQSTIRFLGEGLVDINNSGFYNVNYKILEREYEIQSISGNDITLDTVAGLSVYSTNINTQYQAYLTSDDLTYAQITAINGLTITVNSVPSDWNDGIKLYRKFEVAYEPGNIIVATSNENEWNFNPTGALLTSGAALFNTEDTGRIGTAQVGNQALPIPPSGTRYNPSTINYDFEAGQDKIVYLTGFGTVDDFHVWGPAGSTGRNRWIVIEAFNNSDKSDVISYKFKGISTFNESGIGTDLYYATIDTNETPLTSEIVDAILAKSTRRIHLNQVDISVAAENIFESPWTLTQNGGPIPTHFGARSRRTVEGLTDDYSQFQGVSIPGNRPENNDDYDTWKDSFTWFELDRGTASAITPAYRVIVRRAPDLDWATNPIDTGNGYRSLETSTLNAGSGVNKQFIINADAGTVVNPDDLTTYIDRPNGIATGSIRIYDATNTRYVLAIQVNSSDDIPTTLVEGNTIYLDTTSGVTLAGITTPTKGAFYSYRATAAEWIVTPVE